MSRFTSLFPSGFLGASAGNKERSAPADSLKLRFSLETLPNSRRFTFTHDVRAEVLSELYDALWGQYMSFFVPSTLSTLPPNTVLSHVQKRYNFHGAGNTGSNNPGHSCGHIFVKGESCYRCK